MRCKFCDEPIDITEAYRYKFNEKHTFNFCSKEHCDAWKPPVKMDLYTAMYLNTSRNIKIPTPYGELQFCGKIILYDDGTYCHQFVHFPYEELPNLSYDDVKEMIYPCEPSRLYNIDDVKLLKPEPYVFCGVFGIFVNGYLRYVKGGKDVMHEIKKLARSIKNGRENKKISILHKYYKNPKYTIEFALLKCCEEEELEEFEKNAIWLMYPPLNGILPLTNFNLGDTVIKGMFKPVIDYDKWYEKTTGIEPNYTPEDYDLPTKPKPKSKKDKSYGFS